MLRPVLLLPLLLFAAPAQAQAPPSPGAVLGADRSLIAACLSRSGAPRESCIGAVAVACVRGQGGDAGVAAIACARREEAVWRERLAAAGRRALGSADPTRRGRFAALQGAWESYVAQKCAFDGAMQAPARAAGRQAGCEAREVALRTLELERIAGQPAPRRRAGPPRIIR